MTLKHLRELLNAVPLDKEHLEIEVWLPGSRITLHGGPIFGGLAVLIEGNLKPGSALEETSMTPHWHDQNPWRDRITYVPIERLAECVAGGTIFDHGVVKPYDVAWLLAHWRQCGHDMLDAYILPQPHGRHSLGVRWGADGPEYYSPHNAHPEKTQALLAEFGKP